MKEGMETRKAAESHPHPESLLSSAIVIAGPSSRDLGINISNSMGLSIIYPEFHVFSDGESKIRIIENLKNKICILVQSICPPQIDRYILQTLMILKKCVDDSAKDIIAVVPYMAYARQDKAFLEGEVITMELMAKLFKTFGTRHIVTVDIHSLRALTYFKRTMDSINISAVPLLANYAKAILGMNRDNSIIVSPDVGGFERAQKFAYISGSDVMCMKKLRDRKTGEVFIDYGSSIDRDRVSGRDVVLVDDIISTGNTLMEAAEILKSDGCREIIAMCTHALMNEESFERIKAAGVAKIVATNSIPKVTGIRGFVEEVDLSSILAPALSRIIA
jgi:ribose-phosphate pyrophosphokinase